MIKRGLPILVMLIIIANAAESVANDSKNYGVQDNENGFDEYFQEYFTYESMLEALNHLEAHHPDIVKIYDLTATIDKNRKDVPSNTWQGRTVWAVKVSDGVDTEPDYYSDPNEADILIIGAHHGDEWPSFEVSMYFLFYLVENYGKMPLDNDGDEEVNEDPIDGIDNDEDGIIDEDGNEGKVTWLVDNREIWIIPMLNPDGVVMDQRKNGREEVPGGPFGGTVPTDGIDINRNYPFMWNSEPDPQTGPTMDSSNPMSGTYRGPDDNFDDDGDSIYPHEYLPSGVSKRTVRNVDEDPVDNFDNDNDGDIDEDPDGGFSEPETVALRNLIKALDGNNDDQTDVITSISYHTHGAMIIYPWGYTTDPSPNDGLFQYVGQELSDYNGYDVMQGPGLYPTSGDLDDWLYGIHDVIAYTFELNSGSHRGEEKDIINISMLNLPCNIYLAEMAPIIEVARERFIPSLDIGLPVINHTQKKKVINSDNTYKVEVEISNSEKLTKNSVFLYYKAGESGEWSELQMSTNDDIHYKATIPRHSGGKHIYYYIEAKAKYNEAKSIDEIILVTSPKYGQYDPHSYYVDISLGDTAGDIAAMILMMALMFGIIYSGLGKSLKMAIEAEKRKNAL